MLTVGLYGVPDPRGEHAAHDHAIALVRDGRVLASIELERVTGRKHDNRLDRYFDELVLPWLKEGEPLRVVQANSFLGSSFTSSSGSLRLSAPDDIPLAPRLVPTRCAGTGILAGIVIDAFSVCHELAHVASCLPFFGDFLPETLLVHVDGGASVSASSAWYWDGASLSLVESSWDELKAAVNNFNDSPLTAAILGMDLSQHLSLPGKLMGLASFGTPRADVKNWLEENGFFLGTRWRSADMIAEIKKRFGPRRSDDPTREPVHQDVAACLQKFFEEQIVGYLGRLKARSGARHLCYAGGAALNVHANVRIENELGFESVRIPPAPSDSGLALGAAAFAEWLDGNRMERHDPYLTRLTPDEPAPGDAPSVACGAREIARRLAAGEIVAAIMGCSEVGPRSLGHRSLFARPDSVPTRRRLSEGLKQREWYRPVAPMLLPEVAAQCLENFRPGSTLARHMLGAWRVRPEWREALAGCIHADGTARVQVLDPTLPSQAPLVELLRVLAEEHGIQGVINTSLNGRGVAMLHSTVAAASEARRVGADAVWA
jgi:carbamoyltransferase